MLRHQGAIVLHHSLAGSGIALGPSGSLLRGTEGCGGFSGSGDREIRVTSSAAHKRGC